MALRREQVVKSAVEDLLDELATQEARVARPAHGIGREDALACVEAALTSRLIDLEARELKNAGAGYYTIGSAGHEGNAVVGRLLRTTDPCLLHYRSGALLAARSRKVPGESFVWDTMLSLVASAEDPVSAGRHKVWGSRRLWVPPQTSTIASHVPKATGMAFSLARAAHLGVEDELPDDSIVACSFGDASVNHASAQTAFNAAAWAAHQHIPVPVLFVCEDNGVGISVHTPRDWIERSMRSRLDYFEADGCDLEATWAATRRAIDHCRRHRRPTFLRLEVVRLLGHAGSDVEASYHDEDEIEATEARDPLLRMLRFVVDAGFASGVELRDAYRRLLARIERVGRRAVARPKLENVEEIVAPLRAPDRKRVSECARRLPDEQARTTLWEGQRLPEEDRPRHMAMQISRALTDLMGQHEEMLLFGEDVAKKGGVYHVTAGLYERFGVGRVFNTLLDETMILALAIGAAQIGFLPVPEIQYLAYLHNAEDQLRGEAASQRFFSDCQWDNPMVVRIASFAYQKGFGGHFHNDNSIGVLRDIPGLVIAAPSRADDAVEMLRTCVAAARETRAVCAFLEPIALYMSKDVFDKNDGLWSFAYPAPGRAATFGAPRLYDADDVAGREVVMDAAASAAAASVTAVNAHADEATGGDGVRGAAATSSGAAAIGATSRGAATLLVISYANGVPMTLRARKRFAERQRDIDVRLLDLRWLAPLPIDEACAFAQEADAVLVVDECRKSGGGVAEALLAAFAERGIRCPMQRINAVDSYVPLGAAANLVLPQDDDVLAALESLARELVS